MIFKNKTIPFLIENIDPLGQGVSKIGSKITFIPKTLVGEKGTAKVFKESKGVNFAFVNEIEAISEKRVKPQCDHFDKCNGCAYLHMRYDEEIDLKNEVLKRLFKDISIPEIETHKAINRLQYRNRIQLHYDKYLNKIGYISKFNNEIIEVPKCKIANDEVTTKLQNIYQNNNWVKLLSTEQPSKGHLEIYNSDLYWNENYAKGGFSQVNFKMNELLKNSIAQNFKIVMNDVDSILDLFGGEGNLTNELDVKYRKIVDSTDCNMQNFIKLDLYSKESLATLKDEVKQEIDLLIIDPPRTGFKNIDEYVREFDPKYLMYVSCNPFTLVRDLKSLSMKFDVMKLQLFDFFPATSHFETLVQIGFAKT